MRPGQNKRLRGRNNNNNNSQGRKGPNPLTRSFESNGPDVKIRGTAQHVAEKYLQLARDAQSSGDPVMAENYLQHAEHYYRVIAAAHQAQQQAAGFGNRMPPDIEDDEEGIEEDDRFASVAERLPQPPQPVYQQPAFQQPAFQQPTNPQQQGAGPNQGPAGGQAYGERQSNQAQRPWRENRQDGQRQDGQRQDGQRQDGNRQDGNRQEYRGDNRRDFRNEPRGDNREQRPDTRTNEPRPEGGERPERQGQTGEQPWRNENRRPREAPARPEGGEPEEGVGLPAFITGSRPATEGAAPGDQPDMLGGPDQGDAAGYHLRPRRRRRGRPGTDQAGEPDAGPQDDAGPRDDAAPQADDRVPITE